MDDEQRAWDAGVFFGLLIGIGVGAASTLLALKYLN